MAEIMDQLAKEFPDVHIPAPKPDDEDARLKYLHSLSILDTVPDPAIDNIVELLSRLFKVPIVLVSILDSERQWFKARTGIDAAETPRDWAFCGHTLLPDMPEILFVPDATQDPRFCRNPLVLGPPFIRFYCGAPILVENQRLGTLCLIDKLPRVDMSREQAMQLTNFADIIASLLIRSRVHTECFELVEHPCVLVKLEGVCPKEWPIMYSNKAAETLFVEGGFNYVAADDSRAEAPGRGCNYFSDLIVMEGCDALVASPLQNEHIVAFNGRFRSTDMAACLCYIFPSSRQIKNAGVGAVAFPYATTASSQPGHAFIVVKRVSPRAQVAVLSSRSQKHGIRTLWTLADFEQFRLGPNGGVDSPDSSQYVVALFTSTVCRACVNFHSFYTAMSEMYRSKVDFGEVDIESAPELTGQLLGMTYFVPTVLFFNRSGEQVAAVQGSSAKQFRDWLVHFAGSIATANRMPAPEPVLPVLDDASSVGDTDRADSPPTLEPIPARQTFASRWRAQLGRCCKVPGRTKKMPREEPEPLEAACHIMPGVDSSSAKCSTTSVARGRGFPAWAGDQAGEKGFVRHADLCVDTNCEDDATRANEVDQSLPSIHVLGRALEAERAYSAALAKVFRATSTDTQKSNLEEGLQAKLELLQKQRNAMSKRGRRRVQLDTLAEEEACSPEVEEEKDVPIDRVLPPFMFKYRIKEVLQPLVQNRMTWVFGSRARMLAEGIQDRGYIARYGKTVKRPDGVILPKIDASGRQGRPLAVVYAASADSSTTSVGEWFFEVSDSLGEDGIYVLMTSDEISLEVTTMLAECCSWQIKREEDTGGDFTMLLLKKTLGSDVKLRKYRARMTASSSRPRQW